MNDPSSTSSIINSQILGVQEPSFGGQGGLYFTLSRKGAKSQRIQGVRCCSSVLLLLKCATQGTIIRVNVAGNKKITGIKIHPVIRLKYSTDLFYQSGFLPDGFIPPFLTLDKRIW